MLLDKNEQDKLFTQIAKSVVYTIHTIHTIHTVYTIYFIHTIHTIHTIQNPNKESFNAATIINVRNLVHYFKNDPNPVLKHIIPHKEVILTAHKHACERVQYLTIKKEKLKGTHQTHHTSYTIYTIHTIQTIQYTLYTPYTK